MVTLRDAAFMVLGMAILLLIRLAVAWWWHRRPALPAPMFLDLTSRERRQMLYHDDDDLF